MKEIQVEPPVGQHIKLLLLVVKVVMSLLMLSDCVEAEMLGVVTRALLGSVLLMLAWLVKVLVSRTALVSALLLLEWLLRPAVWKVGRWIVDLARSLRLAVLQTCVVVEMLEQLSKPAVWAWSLMLAEMQMKRVVAVLLLEWLLRPAMW